MLIDLIVFFLLIAAILHSKVNSNFPELGFIIYVFLTIPLFIAVTFPKVKFRNSLMTLNYIGIIRIHRPIQNLRFSLTSGADGINITNIDGQRFVTIYQNNTANYNDIRVFLGSRVMGSNNLSIRNRKIYVMWLGVGLLLWLINLLI